MSEANDLPYYERPDLSPYLIHLTKNTEAKDKYSAFDNLTNILQTGEVWGSEKRTGFIKGPHPAACFMDIPFSSLKYVLNARNCDLEDPRYEPFGIVVTKKYAYAHGCRPVLYMSNQELVELRIPETEKWRVVRFEGVDSRSVNWAHEREWRCKGDFTLPQHPIAAIVEDSDYAEKLRKRLGKNPNTYKATPRNIIPLTVLCQGLPYLS